MKRWIPFLIGLGVVAVLDWGNLKLLTAASGVYLLGVMAGVFLLMHDPHDRRNCTELTEDAYKLGYTRGVQDGRREALK